MFFFFFNPQLCVIAYPHEPRVIRRFLTVGAVVLVDGSIVGYGPATVIEPSYVRVYVYKCKTEEIIKKKKKYQTKNVHFIEKLQVSHGMFPELTYN